MEIKTKFAIGDGVWTIRKCKAVSFEIGCVMYDESGVYYGVYAYELTPESQCFATKEELLKHVADD